LQPRIATTENFDRQHQNPRVEGQRSFGDSPAYFDAGYCTRATKLVVGALTLSFLPELVRYVRSSTISQFAEEYVLVQRAFGASWAEILFRHFLKNVLLLARAAKMFGAPVRTTCCC